MDHPRIGLGRKLGSACSARPALAKDAAATLSRPATAAPALRAIALEERSRFAIREGNRTVGAGIVTEIVE